MRKFLTGTDLGGMPIYKSDFRDPLNADLWAAIDGLLSVISGDTQGVIISGCVFTNNAGNFDMTAGVVYLDGEFMRVPAATNLPFTRHIRPATPVSDSRTFGNGVSHAVLQTKDAEINAATGGSQYITISSLTSADSRRLSNLLMQKSASDVYLRTKIVEIGDWNMDATTSVGVAHGITDWKKIRGFEVVIRNDADNLYYNLYVTSGGSNTVQGSVDTFDSTSVTLSRFATGTFDNAGFDSTSYNRGWVKIIYEA